jgi:hypothetical protein
MKIGRFVISFSREEVDIEKIKKEARDQAFREALVEIRTWQKSAIKTFEKRRDEEKDYSWFGVINLFDLCIQRVSEKIDGVRRWS